MWGRPVAEGQEARDIGHFCGLGLCASTYFLGCEISLQKITLLFRSFPLAGVVGRGTVRTSLRPGTWAPPDRCSLSTCYGLGAALCTLLTLTHILFPTRWVLPLCPLGNRGSGWVTCHDHIARGAAGAALPSVVHPACVPFLPPSAPGHQLQKFLQPHWGILKVSLYPLVWVDSH